MNDDKKNGRLEPKLLNKRILLLFAEPSFRTRSAFEVAAVDLGASAHFFDGRGARLYSAGDGGEDVTDLSEMINGFYDAALVRLYNNKYLMDLVKNVHIPIINGMCDIHHPTQALCDAYTIIRNKGSLIKPKVVFVGDFTNVARSIAQLLSKMGGQLILSCPKQIYLSDCNVKDLVEYFEDPFDAVSEADVIITDVWVPMNANRTSEDLKIFIPYSINEALCRFAHPDFIFMHNLPAHRGMEVESTIIDGENSVVYEEAVARLDIARGVLSFLINEGS